MALDFPNNPSHNATATVGTVNYKFDSAAQTWTAIPISTQFDSSTATNLIDSDYIQTRQIAAAPSIEWQSTIQTGSTFTAQVNKAYWTDTTSNTITASLPTSVSSKWKNLYLCLNIQSYELENIISSIHW